ncbi:MAG TPA: helix-hairpin-helix domain-containing protein, partial [Solirubrobacteraceae bacterium]|nr:helix-hairpin-helix domain-containing protein [Solirubrobacteraceae bacterium]
MRSDPSNPEIAAAFDELADLYELDGAIVHRVMAYRAAAKAAREATVSVAALTRKGTVTSLPGIGRTLEEKLVALLETGSIPATVKLRAKYPPGLLDMTRLPGLGPKRARKLFDELGIDSLDALRVAGEGQQLRDVKGFGPSPGRRVMSRSPGVYFARSFSAAGIVPVSSSATSFSSSVLPIPGSDVTSPRRVRPAT